MSDTDPIARLNAAQEGRYRIESRSRAVLAEIVALDMAAKTRKTVLADAMDPRYVTTGHLLFMRQGSLMTIRFDPDPTPIRSHYSPTAASISSMRGSRRRFSQSKVCRTKTT